MSIKENAVKIKNAADVLTSAIRNDSGLRDIYKANISVEFRNAWNSQAAGLKPEELYKIDIHDVANNAAENFLDWWCGSGLDELRNDVVVALDKLHTAKHVDKHAVYDGLCSIQDKIDDMLSSLDTVIGSG